MDIIQWPPFLLASKIPIALDMAADSGGKDRDLKKRMKSDPYFTYAIKECYASFKNIIYTLVVGLRERDVIQKIFTVVDDHITQDTLIKELNMTNLPTLKTPPLPSSHPSPDLVVGFVGIFFGVFAPLYVDARFSCKLDLVRNGVSMFFSSGFFFIYRQCNYTFEMAVPKI